MNSLPGRGRESPENHHRAAAAIPRRGFTGYGERVVFRSSDRPRSGCPPLWDGFDLGTTFRAGLLPASIVLRNHGSRPSRNSADALVAVPPKLREAAFGWGHAAGRLSRRFAYDGRTEFSARYSWG